MRVVFINEPALAPVGWKDEWVLLDDFYVRIEDDEGMDIPFSLVIKKGFSTDLASVPRLPGAYLLFANRARRSAILHDFLYEQRFPREWADRVFRAAMKNEDVGAVSRFFMWLGVRVAGGAYYTEVAGDKPPVDPYNLG